MNQLIILSFISVALSIQLLVGPWVFSMGAPLSEFFPASQLPVTSTAACSSQHCLAVFTWKRGEGWGNEMGELLSDREVSETLDEVVRVTDELGYLPVIRVRVPADTSAEPFVRLAMMAEQAGVARLQVAVMRGDR